MKIVEFNNGEYGIRMPWYNFNNLLYFGRVYVDLRSSGEYHWPQGSIFFSDCKGTLEQCKRFLDGKTKLKIKQVL